MGMYVTDAFDWLWRGLRGLRGLEGVGVAHWSLATWINAVMALSARREELKRVPWFSLSEWHRVYEEIYSNDTKLQAKGYETLLVWKCRIPKLPVGVECTLSLIQVCLRDREWTPKISTGDLPIHYENDLSLMYCTTIMRFLNQISNIGPTKQTSLFQIAKQLKIPEWIVHLRHDAAHGHELPSISLLRMASNILLSWLHDEYWKAEAQILSDVSDENSVTLIREIASPNRLIDIIELWMSVGLYLEADFKIVADLPDDHLKSTLKDLYIHAKTSKKDFDTSLTSDVFDDKLYRLSTARSYLLTEIYNEIRKNKDEKSIKKGVVDFLLGNEAFLFTADFMKLFLRKSPNNSNDDDNNCRDTNLPEAFIKFWQHFILMLHEMKILEYLTKSLLKLVNSRGENRQRRKSASLWLKSIGQCLKKLKIAQREFDAIDEGNKGKKMSQKVLNQKLQSMINSKNPELRGGFWLGINFDVPQMFLEENFAAEILMNPDEFSLLFIEEFLDLITPEIGEIRKKNLVEMLRIQGGEVDDDDGGDGDVVHTVEELRSFLGDGNEEIEDNRKLEEELDLADKTIRNLEWEVAVGDFNWRECAFGVLPWQMDAVEVLEMENSTPEIVPATGDWDIIPGIIDRSKLRMGKRVNWENVLRKREKKKRGSKREAEKELDKAMEIVKTRRI